MRGRQGIATARGDLFSLGPGQTQRRATPPEESGGGRVTDANRPPCLTWSAPRLVELLQESLLIGDRSGMKFGLPLAKHSEGLRVQTFRRPPPHVGIYTFPDHLLNEEVDGHFVRVIANDALEPVAQSEPTINERCSFPCPPRPTPAEECPSRHVRVHHTTIAKVKSHERERTVE